MNVPTKRVNQRYSVKKAVLKTHKKTLAIVSFLSKT